MRQGAGTTVLCKPAFRFSHFYLSKAGFHVSYTRELFPVKLNALDPPTVSVSYRAKVTTLPRESDVLSI